MVGQELVNPMRVQLVLDGTCCETIGNSTMAALGKNQRDARGDKLRKDMIDMGNDKIFFL
jgi:hypothetical protein